MVLLNILTVSMSFIVASFVVIVVNVAVVVALRCLSCLAFGFLLYNVILSFKL